MADEDGRKSALRWSDRMEEAYEEALQQLGGLEEAKPRDMLEALVSEFPQLTRKNVKWHMVSHRKRVERLRVSDSAGAAATSLSLPLKWAGPLGEAFEDAVAGLGGLQAARPAAIVALLGPCFPEVTAQNVKWHLRKLRVKAARQQGVARNAGSQASLSQAVAGVGQTGGAVPLRAADSSPAAIKGECHSGRLADNATGPLASAAASWQLGAHETAAAALVSEASGSSVNVPGTAAAQRAELLQQQLMAAPGVAAAAMASAAAVVTSATVGAAAAVPPQPDATPPISSVGWELFLLQSTLRALDLHRIHGVIVQQLEAALLRMIAELEQLVAWQRSACSDSPSAMPQSLESLAQYLRENQQLPDSTDQGTFGSWGSNPAADKDSAIAVPATSEQTQTQTQIPHPVAPGSDRPHCIETCDIPGCHFCLYELRRRLRRAGQGSNMEPDPPAPE